MFHSLLSESVNNSKSDSQTVVKLRLDIIMTIKAIDLFHSIEGKVQYRH